MPEQAIKTLVVDSDESSVISLTQLIQDCCPEIEIVSVCNSLKQAVTAINEFHPQLVLRKRNCPMAVVLTWFKIGMKEISEWFLLPVTAKMPLKHSVFQLPII